MTARIMKLCVHALLKAVPYSGTYAGSSIPHRDTTFSNLQSAHKKSGAHQVPYLMGKVSRAAGVLS